MFNKSSAIDPSRASLRVTRALLRTTAIVLALMSVPALAGTTTYTASDNPGSSDLAAGDTYVLTGGNVVFGSDSSADFTFDGTVTGDGGLSKEGSKTLTLNAVNSYTGGTTISGGTVEATVSGALPTGGAVAMAGGTLNLGADQTIGNLSGTGQINVGSSTLNVNATGVTEYSGSIGDSVTKFTYVGSWTVYDGENWTTSPTSLSGQEAAAAIFGGKASDYVTSTASSNVEDINYMVWGDTYGVGQTGPVAQDYTSDSDGDGLYDSYGDFSAYVRDNFVTETNYAFLYSQTEGGGGLTLTGGGTLILSGINTYTGDTRIYDGVLSVNGSIASAVYVYSGGTLGGYGTVGSTTIKSGGTLSPGNSIGALTVAGNLTLESGSTYAIEVASDGSSDQTHVTGAASLDGTLALSTNDGKYAVGTSYTILTADGGITGDFSQVTGNEISAFLNLSNSAADGAGEQGNDYVLVVTRNDYDTVATNPNQAAVANGLQGIIDSEGSDDLIGKIDNMNADEAVALFNGLSPEAYGAYATALQDQAGLFTRQVTQHVSTTGVGGKMGVWANGYGQWSQGDNSGYRYGSNQKIAGFAGGVDFGLKALRLGIVGGYSQDSVTYLPGNSSGKSKAWQIGGYAAYAAGGLHVDAQLAYLHANIDAIKTVQAGSEEEETLISGTASVRATGHVVKGIATVGYDFGDKVMLLQPYVGLDFTSGRVNGFSETGMGALNLAVDDIDAGRTDVLLGVKVAAKAKGVTPYLNAKFKKRISDDARDMTAYFNGVSSAAFTVSAVNSGRWQGDLDVGLTATIGNHARVFVGYQGTYRADVISHGLNGGISFGF